MKTTRLAVTLTTAFGLLVGCAAPTVDDEPVADSTSELESYSTAGACGGAGFLPLWRATAKYHDPAVAIADGYLPAPFCASSPAGGMGIHYVNRTIAFAPPDPVKPSMLIYEPQADGSRKLVAVEWITFVFCNGQPYLGSNIPNDASTPPNFAGGTCFPTPSSPPNLYGHNFEGPMPGHEPGMPWHYEMHAWVWKYNPSGVFSPWNPRVTCTP